MQERKRVWLTRCPLPPPTVTRSGFLNPRALLSGTLATTVCFISSLALRRSEEQAFLLGVLLLGGRRAGLTCKGCRDILSAENWDSSVFLTPMNPWTVRTQLLCAVESPSHLFPIQKKGMPWLSSCVEWGGPQLHTGIMAPCFRSAMAALGQQLVNTKWRPPYLSLLVPIVTWAKLDPMLGC